MKHVKHSVSDSVLRTSCLLTFNPHSPMKGILLYKLKKLRQREVSNFWGFEPRHPL